MSPPEPQSRVRGLDPQPAVAPEPQPGVAQTVRILWDLAGKRAPQLGRALALRGANAVLMAVPVVVVAVLVRDLQQGGISAERAWTVSVILVIALAAQLALAIRANAVLWIASYLAGRDLRVRLLHHVRRLPIGFHSGRQAGDTLTALARDPRELENFLGWSLPSLIADLILPAAVIAILLVVDPTTAASVAVAVIASIPALRWTLRRYARFATARQELQAFLLELGHGFAFIGRQYHFTVDDDDFYIDLLFFNWAKSRFVVVELKIGRFEPEHAGQLGFYVAWV